MRDEVRKDDFKKLLPAPWTLLKILSLMPGDPWKMDLAGHSWTLRLLGSLQLWPV